MFTLDSKQTTDNFPADGSSGGAMLIARAGSNGGYASVTVADVYVQLAYSPDGVTLEWTPAVHVGVGNIILEKGTRGIRFKSYTVGTPATVSAGLSEPVEPSLQLTSAGVAPSSTTMVMASYLLSPAQSIPSSVQTTITVNTVEQLNDPNGVFALATATGIVTVTAAGFYLITGVVFWAAAAGGSRLPLLVAGGATQGFSIGNGTFPSVSSVAALALSAGSTIHLDGFQDSGGALNASAARLAIMKVV